jgi:ATP-dependent DNA helicase RecG
MSRRSSEPGQDPIFTEVELRRLLEREEGQFIEFKSLYDRSQPTPRPLDRRQARDLTVEYVAAFANADGGTLVLGVDDDGAPTGHAYPEEAVQALFEAPAKRLRPEVTLRTQRLTIDGAELLVFQVPMAPEAVMVDGNGFPYRAGDRVIKEPQEVINSRRQAYRRVGWEQRVRAEATLDDLDLELASGFLGRTVFKGRPVEDLLARYGLLLPRAGGAALTNAALLLFGRAPLVRWHPRAGLRFFRVAGNQVQRGGSRNVTQLGRIEAPLAQAIEETHRLAREQIRRSEKLHDLFFREMPEYPEFAWQEAIVNAFAHRDYEDQGREIEVWFFDDRLEIRSPGEPVPPVTLKLLQERSPIHASRNPLVVRVLADAGIMREEGEGIPRMFEEMESSFLHAPELLVEGGEFKVTLRNEPVFVGQKRILIARPDGFSNEEYRTLNSVNRDQAYREIQQMVEQGILVAPEAHGRGAVYRLAPGLHETRTFLARRLPALRMHLATAGFLKNADYRTLFETTRFVALRELRRLVADGYLTPEGERRGARYVAGPALRQSQNK